MLVFLLPREFVAAFIDFPKVLVAAVNGPAVGIPVTLLGLCDVVYASDKVRFTFHYQYKFVFNVINQIYLMQIRQKF